MVAISGIADASAASSHRWTELIPDPALLCDAEGTILKANSQARVFFGVAESQLSGVPVLWIIPASSRERFLLSWNRRSLPMCPCDAELAPVAMPDTGSRTVPIWLTIDEIRSFGKSQFILVFKHGPTPDIIEPPVVATVSQHLSSVRHKIRNPLSGITVFADVLLRNKPGNLDDTQIDQLTAIRDAAGDLASLVNDIDVPRKVPVDQTA